VHPRAQAFAVSDAKRALVSLVVGREVVRHVAELFARAKIPLLPLKGVWLQALVYTPQEPRAISDVDLLVHEAAFDAAVQELERAGFERRSGNISEICLSHPEFGLAVDLHKRLFTRGAFRLPTADVFARSRRDSTAFGVELCLPDPRDVFAHLIGHFVKSRTHLEDPVRINDFVMMADRCAIDPADCARHLHAVGMARAARYVLHGLSERTSRPFFRTLLLTLPDDPIGERIARLARVSGRAPFGSATLMTLSGFALDASLPAGARALAFRAWDHRYDQPLSVRGRSDHL
jgi:Uncharacterised nucleotidyltransferase